MRYTNYTHNNNFDNYIVHRRYYCTEINLNKLETHNLNLHWVWVYKLTNQSLIVI